MRGEIHSIDPDGSVAVTEVSGSGGSILRRLQAAVGGYIERVPFFESFEGKPAVAFCNEEGKIKQLPLNPRATELWRAQAARSPDFLVGTVAVVTGDREFLRTL